MIQASIGQQPNSFPDFRDRVSRFVSGAINDDYSLGVPVCAAFAMHRKLVVSVCALSVAASLTQVQLPGSGASEHAATSEL